MKFKVTKPPGNFKAFKDLDLGDLFFYLSDYFIVTIGFGESNIPFGVNVNSGQARPIAQYAEVQYIPPENYTLTINMP